MTKPQCGNCHHFNLTRHAAIGAEYNKGVCRRHAPTHMFGTVDPTAGYCDPFTAAFPETMVSDLCGDWHPASIALPAPLVAPERPYTGPIEPGMGFIWEPTLPHARDIAVVATFMPGGPGGTSPEGRVHSFGRMSIGRPDLGADPNNPNGVWNDEGRFREAVVRCPMLDQPPFAVPGA